MLPDIVVIMAFAGQLAENRDDGLKLFPTYGGCGNPTAEHRSRRGPVHALKAGDRPERFG
jgi:hypothetical protein